MIEETRRIRLYVGISSIFISIIMALVVAIAVNNYLTSTATAEKTAGRLFEEIATNVEERIDSILESVQTIVDATSTLPVLANPPQGDALLYPIQEMFIRLTEKRPYIFGISIGYDKGEWYQVIAHNGSKDVISAFNIPSGAEFLVKSISKQRDDGEKHQYITYLNSNRRTVGSNFTRNATYDPRVREWYKSALPLDQTVFSDPFIFKALQKPGITGSRKLINGNGVVTVGITLTDLSRFIKEHSASRNAISFLFNAKGEISVHQQQNSKKLEEGPGVNGTADDVSKETDSSRDLIVDAVIDKFQRRITDVAEITSMELNGQKHLLHIRNVGDSVGLDMFIAVAAPLSDFTSHINEMQQRNILWAALSLFIALPLIFVVSRRIAAKLKVLALEADKIKKFDLEHPIEVNTVFLEVHNLAKAFDAMRQAVSVFGRYVPKAVVKEIVQSRQPPELGGHRQEVAVLFTDVASYTEIAERTDPEELMLLTSEYFDALASTLFRHHGIVDKYIGDAIMALWNAPSLDSEYPLNACKAALACRESSRNLAMEWEEKSIVPFKTRLGLHAGEAIVGNVGGADRMNFTAVGATINLAARLESLNKQYMTEILVSEAVVARAESQFLFRLVDIVIPVGVSAPVKIYELVAAHPTAEIMHDVPMATANQMQLIEMWGKALDRYFGRDWSEAIKIIEDVLEQNPEDGPGLLYRKRCLKFIETPPEADWNGVRRLKSK